MRSDGMISPISAANLHCLCHYRRRWSRSRSGEWDFGARGWHCGHAPPPHCRCPRRVRECAGHISGHAHCGRRRVGDCAIWVTTSGHLCGVAGGMSRTTHRFHSFRDSGQKRVVIVEKSSKLLTAAVSAGCAHHNLRDNPFLSFWSRCNVLPAAAAAIAVAIYAYAAVLLLRLLFLLHCCCHRPFCCCRCCFGCCCCCRGCCCCCCCCCGCCCCCCCCGCCCCRYRCCCCCWFAADGAFAVAIAAAVAKGLRSCAGQAAIPIHQYALLCHL